MVGTDSHTPNAGGLGMVAVGSIVTARTIEAVVRVVMSTLVPTWLGVAVAVAALAVGAWLVHGGSVYVMHELVGGREVDRRRPSARDTRNYRNYRNYRNKR